MATKGAKSDEKLDLYTTDEVGIMIDVKLKASIGTNLLALRKCLQMKPYLPCTTIFFFQGFV